ncbi:MAG: hypothetical protein Q8P49_02560 [Candidatus Liptonbacteria bacterium]|nr:hypothetical protein [Candidatus Liptonbacteria bacterium]
MKVYVSELPNDDKSTRKEFAELGFRVTAENALEAEKLRDFLARIKAGKKVDLRFEHGNFYILSYA